MLCPVLAAGQSPVEFQSPVNTYGNALAYEEKNTVHINELCALAAMEKDCAS